MREEQKRGSWKGKLGHVEKSSCNDPNQEPGRKLACLPLFFVKVYLSFSSFSSLWYSVKLSGLLFYFPIPSSPETTSLHLYIFYLLYHLLIPSPLFSPVWEITHPTTNHTSSSNLAISRSKYTSNGVTLVQRSIIEAETQRRGNVAFSKQKQIHFNRIHEVVGKAQASFVWRIREAGTNTHKHRSGETGRARKSREELAWHFLCPMKMRDVSKQSTPNTSWCSVHFLSASLSLNPVSRMLIFQLY